MIKVRNRFVFFVVLFPVFATVHSMEPNFDTSTEVEEEGEWRVSQDNFKEGFVKALMQKNTDRLAEYFGRYPKRCAHTLKGLEILFRVEKIIFPEENHPRSEFCSCERRHELEENFVKAIGEGDTEALSRCFAAEPHWCASMLVKKGVNGFNFHSAVRSGNTGIVRMLLRLSGCFGFRALTSYDCACGKWSPLGEAVVKGDLPMVQALFEGGRDGARHSLMMCRDLDQITPFHIASGDVLCYLLCKGGDRVEDAMQLFDKNGFTPLHRAAFEGRDKDIEIMMEHGGEGAQRALCMGGGLQRSKFMNYTPLHVALVAEKVECVSVLVRYEVPLDAIDSDGNIPLDLLREIHYGYSESVRLCEEGIELLEKQGAETEDPQEDCV